MKKYGLFKQKHWLSTKSRYYQLRWPPCISCYNMFFLVCIDILPRNFFLIALFFPSAESPLPIGGAARHFFPSVESVLHIDDILIGLCLSSHCSCHSLASVPYIFHFTQPMPSHSKTSSFLPGLGVVALPEGLWPTPQHCGGGRRKWQGMTRRRAGKATALATLTPSLWTRIRLVIVVHAHQNT